MKEILSNAKIAAYFQTLDLDLHEGAALFHLLDNGDGEVAWWKMSELQRFYPMCPRFR